MAVVLGATPEAVHDYMRRLCQDVALYPGISGVLRRRHARGGKQAIVTVNPAIFDEVAECHSMGDWFDEIVTSAACGTDEKRLLCLEALRLMGVDDAGQSVLIDNMADNVTAWRESGGLAYLFMSDDQFVGDVAKGRVPGFRPEDAFT